VQYRTIFVLGTQGGLNVRGRPAYAEAMALAFGSVVAAAGMLLSCAGTLADPPTSTEDQEVSPQEVSAQVLTPRHDPSGAAVIATLRTRDRELTILSEGGSMRYALLDSAGVSKSLTLDELQAYDPNLFEFVKTAMARASAGVLGATFVDARVEPARSVDAPGASVPVIPISGRNTPVAPGMIGMPRRD
jgi:hypothetical protein